SLPDASENTSPDALGSGSKNGEAFFLSALREADQCLRAPPGRVAQVLSQTTSVYGCQRPVESGNRLVEPARRFDVPFRGYGTWKPNRVIHVDPAANQVHLGTYNTACPNVFQSTGRQPHPQDSDH